MGARLTIDERKQQAFNILVAAAVDGRRCPENETFGSNRSAIGGLARDGRIRIEVYVHNYRVVTILDGEHAGKTTAPCPKKDAKPYRSIDSNGDTLGYQARNRASIKNRASITLPSTTTPWNRR